MKTPTFNYGCDYLRFSAICLSKDFCLQDFSLYPDDEVILLQGQPAHLNKVDLYPDSFNSIYGVCGGICKYQDNGEEFVKFYLQISGSPLQGLTLEDVAAYMQRIDNKYVGGTFTRFDFRIDAVSESYNFYGLAKKMYNEQVQNCFGFRTKRFIPGTFKKIKNQWVQDSDTYYFGSRESSKFLRIYLHKDLASKKEFQRMEYELKKYACNTFAKKFLQVYNEFSNIGELIKFCLNFCLPLFDFRDSGTGNRRKSCLRLIWWIEFLDIFNNAECEKQPLAAPLIKTIFHTAKWITHQVSKTINCFMQSLSKQDFARFLDIMSQRAEKKFNQQDAVKLFQITNFSEDILDYMESLI